MKPHHPTRDLLVVLMVCSSLRGGSSRWSGYLRSLSKVDLPIFWGSDFPKRPNGVSNVSDYDDPLLWLCGTEVQKLLNKRDADGLTLLVRQPVLKRVRQLILCCT